MKFKPGQSVAEAAQALLPKMARKYFKAGRDAVSGKKPPDELHQFRLRTKRFRYTLEFFRPVYGARLDRYLNSLRSMQAALGKVSDYQAIQRVLGRDRLLENQIHQALKRRVKDLRGEWRTLDSDGALKNWRMFLAGEQMQARTPRKRPASVKKSAARKRA
ncbi:MAG TPA: CHAD domain-containing protein [Bryobacteraceae bacterium]|nr:CHAD domain-containing protein [Bryobacteraceae bacterium]